MTAEELHVIMQNSMAQAGCGYVGFEELSTDQHCAMVHAARRIDDAIRRAVDKSIIELYEKQRLANL